jgi:hypothetical protein
MPAAQMPCLPLPHSGQQHPAAHRMCPSHDPTPTMQTARCSRSVSACTFSHASSRRSLSLMPPAYSSVVPMCTYASVFLRFRLTGNALPSTPAALPDDTLDPPDGQLVHSRAAA